MTSVPHLSQTVWQGSETGETPSTSKHPPLISISTLDEVRRLEVQEDVVKEPSTEEPKPTTIV